LQVIVYLSFHKSSRLCYNNQTKESIFVNTVLPKALSCAQSHLLFKCFGAPTSVIIDHCT